MGAARIKGTVLVVDDEPNIRSVCRDALERANYEVILAEDGEAALRHLEATPVDAAVLDIVLPDTDGLQLLQAVKEHSEDAVIVLITGFASLDTAMEAVRLGAYEYVRKPFGAWDLVRIVDRGMEGRRLRGRNDELLDELQRANEELVAQQDQLRERMRIATDDVTAFVDLGRRLSDNTDLGETLHSILAAGRQVTRARAGAIFRVARGVRRLHGVISEGLPGADATRADLAIGNGLLGEVADRGEARIENDVLAGPIADDEVLGMLGVQSVLASPLVWHDEVRGVMAFFDHEEGEFSQDSLHLVRVLSAQAARVLAAMDEVNVGETERGEDDFIDLAELL